MIHLLSLWTFSWPYAALLLVILAYGIRHWARLTKVPFLLALLLAGVSLFSPLQVLSAHYLFSAHMAVHVILLLGVGPLLVMSLPATPYRPVPFFLFLKQHPVLGWLTGIGIMWWWHTPLVFNTMMMRAHGEHFPLGSLLEVTSLVLAGILFSAPVVQPNHQYRMDALSGVVYLFTACTGCSLLGLLITFAPPGVYHHFLSPQDVYGLNSLLLQQWGLTQAADQQAAGLIMWVPCCLIYVSGALYLLVRWFHQKEETTLPLNKIP